MKINKFNKIYNEHEVEIDLIKFFGFLFFSWSLFNLLMVGI